MKNEFDFQLDLVSKEVASLQKKVDQIRMWTPYQ